MTWLPGSLDGFTLGATIGVAVALLIGGDCNADRVP
jgi:hypothetical protein